MTKNPALRLLAGAVLAVAALAATLAMIRHGGIVPAQPWSGRLDPVSVTLAVCSALPLVMWWRFPLAVFVTTSVAAIALTGLGYPADVMIGPTLALYFLAASGFRHIPMVVLFGGYLAAAAIAKGGFPSAELLHSGLAWGVAWFAGERTRLRREQIASLQSRAERAEREAEQDRQLAVAEERARIARDLHDSAGHAISVIAVRAGAARLRHGQDPARSLAALEDIETLARQTAGQLDYLVSNLREREDDLTTPPGVASLDTLLAHHQSAGLTVTTDISGAPPVPGSPADYAVYRIVQEGLTNAARHGSGSAAVTIVFGSSSAAITIANPFPHNGIERPGGGHGLIGMRERVTLLGGTLDISPSNGLFRVQADVPLGRTA